ncbi:MAG: dihydroorotate dehydrogenase [Candidatus Cloacimonadota bacterium]|nr:MAG: dihydroorotate dehydrogenase [Candidatus Cloacimonadota bacterium]PIE77479.1 MAG: dihydroorotate dehydrogenase [Candidatus Delongbacteria bacterium]
MKKIGIILGVVLFLVALFLPESIVADPAQKKVIAIFLLATVLWITEPIPIYTTSVLVIFLELMMLSDKGLSFFKEGTIIKYGDIFNNFSHPLIFLFIGGFFLASATSKYKLDMNLARVILKPFGKKPANIMLGLMIITAIFSMFMSNTATTAMMLSVLIPVIKSFSPTDRGKVALTLSIPLAANIGGIGTPIGTPPNAIALKYLTGNNSIDFGEWMGFGVPYVVVMLLISWLILLTMFKPEAESLEINLKGKFLKSWKAIVVYITFGVTIILWLTGKLHGINSYVVAMIPVAVFSVTGVINKKDLKGISWDVLWLVAGGFALGMAMEKTGMSRTLVNSIPFGEMSPLVLIIVVPFFTLTMGTFMSHTVTVNLLLPIIAALGASLSGLEAFGGSKLIILASTMAASLAMALPVSTPPNAIAHSTGTIETKDMMISGTIICLIGMVVMFGLMVILKSIGFFN